MMNGTKKSDSSIVPAKPANKAERSTAELVEGDDGTKRNAELQSTVRTQSREAVTQAQARIRGAVTRNEKEKLTALLHHVSIDVLRWAFFNIKKQAAPGVDGLTWVDYAADLDRNLTDLHARVHSGAYRALPSRRRYIPKADGKQRPLGIAALEDKIVQAAVVAILTPIYEAEFLGFSYGFRPGRGQHDVLDALAYGINARKINWILDADISRFFDTLSREWLIRFVEHRIGDRRIIRLIQKWLKAGVLEDGRLIETTEGTPARLSGITTACECVSPLRLRSLGRAVAHAPRKGRYDRRAVCRRHNRWIPAPARCGAFPDRSQGTLGKVRAQPAPGKDPPPRVRQICCRTPGRAGPGQAGDVRFPGVHALLHHQEGWRRLPTRAQDTEKANESQAPGDQGNTTTAQAYAD